MRIHLLGTGSAIPSRERANTSLLVSAGNHGLLIDCSGSPVREMLARGYDLNAFRDVFLTHAHVDHLYALPSLVHSFWQSPQFSKQGGAIRVHGHRKTLQVAQKLIRIFELEKKRDPVILEWDAVKRGIVTWAGREHAEVSVFEVVHAGMPTFGIRIRTSDDKTVAYSADTTVDQNVAPQLTRDVNVLIQDCGGGVESNTGHAGARDINRLIRGTAIGRVYLAHLPSLTVAMEEEIRSIATEGFAGEVALAKDGDVIDV
jgi:ribonuclease Z